MALLINYNFILLLLLCYLYYILLNIKRIKLNKVKLSKCVMLISYPKELCQNMITTLVLSKCIEKYIKYNFF